MNSLEDPFKKKKTNIHKGRLHGSVLFGLISYISVNKTENRRIQRETGVRKYTFEYIVNKGFGAIYVAMQTASFSGKALLFSARKCQVLFWTYDRHMFPQ